MKKTRRLGDAIRTGREAIGISQRELGRWVGASAAYVAYLEAGARRPSYSLLFRLTKTLHLNQRQLFLLAYPEAATLISSEPIVMSRQAAWRHFVAGAARYSVTPAEMAILRRISRLGKIASPRSYFWILNSIRQSFEPD